jgi:hypothetical protein
VQKFIESVIWSVAEHKARSKTPLLSRGFFEKPAPNAKLGEIPQSALSGGDAGQITIGLAKAGGFALAACK